MISYRDTKWVSERAPGLDPAVPGAGDRAPDASGLRRQGVGFPLRLFDILRGPEHVLVAHLPGGPLAGSAAELARLAADFRARYGSRVRVVAIGSGDLPDTYGVASYHDAEGMFAKAYGSQSAIFVVRPDGYIGWRGQSWSDESLHAHLNRIFGPP